MFGLEFGLLLFQSWPKLDDKIPGNDIIVSHKSEGKGRNDSHCGNATSPAVIDIIQPNLNLPGVLVAGVVKPIRQYRH